MKTETESIDSISGEITSEKERVQSEQELRAEDAKGSGDEEIAEKPEVKAYDDKRGTLELERFDSPMALSPKRKKVKRLAGKNAY